MLDESEREQGTAVWLVKHAIPGGVCSKQQPGVALHAAEHQNSALTTLVSFHHSPLTHWQNKDIEGTSNICNALQTYTPVTLLGSRWGAALRSCWVGKLTEQAADLLGWGGGRREGRGGSA